jgi:hypothetical protein
MATMAGVSRTTLYKWQRRADWPANPDEATLKSFAAARLAAAAKAQRGQHADLKRAKLEKQVALLTQQARRARIDADAARMKLDVELGKLMPEAEVKTAVIEMQNLCLGIIERWAATITAKRKDKELLSEMQTARDAVLAETTGIIEDSLKTVKGKQ